jgi:hypothetical protein
MKNKSKEATQSPKKGSSSLRRNGKDALGNKQSDHQPESNQDTENDSGESAKNRSNPRNKQQPQMSEFERGYYEGRKAAEHEMHYRQYGHGGGNGHNTHGHNGHGHNGHNHNGHGHNGHSQRNGNIYGENPASSGRDEYRGSNKRHPGLGHSDYIENEYNGATRTQPFKTGNIRGGRGPAMSSQMEYDTYRRNAPSSGFDEDDEYGTFDEHEFHGKGYQSSGQIEGFGHRSGQQNGQDWEEQDEYRDGNAPRKTGKGRYGSR